MKQKGDYCNYNNVKYIKYVKYGTHSFISYILPIGVTGNSMNNVIAIVLARVCLGPMGVYAGWARKNRNTGSDDR